HPEPTRSLSVRVISRIPTQHLRSRVPRRLTHAWFKTNLLPLNPSAQRQMRPHIRSDQSHRLPTCGELLAPLHQGLAHWLHCKTFLRFPKAVASLTHPSSLPATLPAVMLHGPLVALQAG